jgi:hypothetical protein
MELQTSDIVLAAYLKVRKFKMVEIIKVGNKGTFVFENVSDDVISDYDLGQASVEPKALNYEIKALTTAVKR